MNRIRLFFAVVACVYEWSCDTLRMWCEMNETDRILHDALKARR
jgi:hypothetical protein